MILSRIKFFRHFRALTFICLLALGTGGSSERASAEDVALSEEAVANLAKPSVVRITEHVTGTAKIAAVKVDIRNHVVGAVPDRFTEVPVDEFLSGSGFIISPDGYIATNAHVVSLETVKLNLATESALSAIFENALVLNDEEMQRFLEDESGMRFSREVVKFVISHSEFSLEKKISVLQPNTKTTKFSSVVEEGFPAEVISVNDDFIDTERDVAILKIEETNLPAIVLGNSNELSVGVKAHIFGFPATAEVNENNPSEATFTQGVVSAIKQSMDKSFKIFQTDAKVSQGSSGGPLFNERGEVMGIITFQTTELNRSSGDNFAFALPIELVKTQASDARIDLQEGNFGTNFKKGFKAFAQKHCDDAALAFKDARNTNPAFIIENTLTAYEEKCKELKLSGGSADTFWERFQGKARTLGNPILYVIGLSLFLFGIFGAAIFWLLRQMRRDEREIALLERRVLADELRMVRYREGISNQSSPRTPETPKPRKTV